MHNLVSMAKLIKISNWRQICHVKKRLDLAQKVILKNKKGLILTWHKSDNTTALPTELNSKSAFPLVKAYFESEDAKDVDLGRWEEDYQHDGSNDVGCRRLGVVNIML